MIKSLGAPDDYNTIVRCTETFLSPCILLFIPVLFNNAFNWSICTTSNIRSVNSEFEWIRKAVFEPEIKLLSIYM
jgi:hypothetical protein